MLDPKKAAEYLVVAWCKEWKFGDYLDAVMEKKVQHDLTPEVMGEVLAAFPWLPSRYKPYNKSVREFVAGAYPKLSIWLWSRSDDLARLRCASQIERLKCPEVLARFVSAEDRQEMIGSRRDAEASTKSYRLSRDAFKSNQRSAWNVCKG